jgi:hypothetical protein
MRLKKYLSEQDGVSSNPSNQTSGGFANYGMGAVAYKPKDQIDRKKKKKKKEPKEVKKPLTFRPIADTSGETTDSMRQY